MASCPFPLVLKRGVHCKSERTDLGRRGNRKESAATLFLCLPPTIGGSASRGWIRMQVTQSRKHSRFEGRQGRERSPPSAPILSGKHESQQLRIRERKEQENTEVGLGGEGIPGQFPHWQGDRAPWKNWSTSGGHTWGTSGGHTWGSADSCSCCPTGAESPC